MSGHINVHETGAIEATGHKVLAVPSPDGKLTAAQIEEVVQAHLGEDGPEHKATTGSLDYSLREFAQRDHISLQYPLKGYLVCAQ